MLSNQISDSHLWRGEAGIRKERMNEAGPVETATQGRDSCVHQHGSRNLMPAICGCAAMWAQCRRVFYSLESSSISHFLEKNILSFKCCQFVGIFLKHCGPMVSWPNRTSLWAEFGLRPVGAGAGSFQLVRADYKYLFPILQTVTSHQQLKISHSGSVYTTEIG